MFIPNTTKHAIEQSKQNKPKYIADDFEALGIPRVISHGILLARGVYKWMSVRRELIKLKNKWRDELTSLYDILSHVKAIRMDPDQGLYTYADYRYLVGLTHGIEECRKDVRKLCHQSRMSAPDNDSEAIAFLNVVDGHRNKL